MQPVLTIGQVSGRTGLAPSAIRFYEEVGLVRAIRTESGQRRFRRSDIRRLSFVIAAQGFGLTLGEIREMLAKLPDERTPNKADWSRISRIFRSRIDDEISRLETLRNRLDGCIGCGCLSLKSCRLYNPDDAAATGGPGPRYVLGDEPPA
ncbi:MAG: redox-sensitive transcriptional activator SoxR [Pseudomonadota bacterium]